MCKVGQHKEGKQSWKKPVNSKYIEGRLLFMVTGECVLKSSLFGYHRIIVPLYQREKHGDCLAETVIVHGARDKVEEVYVCSPIRIFEK